MTSAGRPSGRDFTVVAVPCEGPAEATAKGTIAVQYGEIIKTVNTEVGFDDPARAEALVRGVLDLLGRRLAGGEPADLASQLPTELKEPLNRHAGPAEPFDVDEFLRRLASQQGEGVDPEQARERARAVLTTLGRFVSDGELRDVREQLPAGYSPLFV